MKVSELIERLKAMPQDMPVYEANPRDSNYHEMSRNPRTKHCINFDKTYTEACVVGRDAY
jgi:hypothetical protein